MKISENFDIREFVPPEIWKRFGKNSIWFVNPIIIRVAQFTKDFLVKYYQEKDSSIKDISVVINSYHYGGNRRWSGLRTVNYINRQIKKGKRPARLSQHIGGQCSAIDQKFYIKYKNGTKKEIPSNHIRKIILAHQKEFMEAGLTTLESDRYAPTWVHSDCRPTKRKTILLVGDKKAKV